MTDGGEAKPAVWTRIEKLNTVTILNDILRLYGVQHVFFHPLTDPQDFQAMIVHGLISYAQMAATNSTADSQSTSDPGISKTEEIIFVPTDQVGLFNITR